MNARLALSEEDEALIRSCEDDERAILIDGKWTKMPAETAGAIYMSAYQRATADALRTLGVDYEVEVAADRSSFGHTFRLKDGIAISDMDHNFDIESESLCTTVTLNDGRTARGFAALKRVRPR